MSISHYQGVTMLKKTILALTALFAVSGLAAFTRKVVTSSLEN